MRKRYQWWAAAMAALAMSVLLAACGGSGANSGGNGGGVNSGAGTVGGSGGAPAGPAAEPDETAELAPESAGGTLTIWGWDTNYIESTFAAFQEHYPNVKLEVTNVAAKDYVQKLQTTLASGGELPDILVGEMGFRGKAFELDIWENLEAPPYSFDRSTVFDYLPSVTSNARGEIVAIEQTVSPAAFAFRRDLASQYFGTDDPQTLEQMFPTWDALIEKGREVRERSGGSVYLFASLGDLTTVLGAQSKVPLLNGETVQATARMKDVLDSIVKVRDAGIVDKLEQWSPQWNASYAGGNHIFYPAANWSPQYVIQPNDPNGAGNWGMMKPPGGAFTWGGTVYGISKTSGNKALAWTYIRWLLLTEEGAEASKALNFYVPLKSVYEDPAFASAPDPFFGGQDIGGLMMNEIAPTIDTPQISPYDSVVTDATALVVADLNGNREATADEALAKLIAEVKAKLPGVDVE